MRLLPWQEELEANLGYYSKMKSRGIEKRNDKKIAKAKAQISLLSNDENKLADIYCSLDSTWKRTLIADIVNNIKSEKNQFRMVMNTDLASEFGLTGAKVSDFIATINDKTLIAEIAKSHAVEYFRRDAIKRIEDDTDLMWILEHDSSPDVAIAVLKKISNKTIVSALCKIAHTNGYGFFYFKLLEEAYNIMSKIPQANVMEYIMQYAKDETIKHFAKNILHDVQCKHSYCLQREEDKVYVGKDMDDWVVHSTVKVFQCSACKKTINIRYLLNGDKSLIIPISDSDQLIFDPFCGRSGNSYTSFKAMINKAEGVSGDKFIEIPYLNIYQFRYADGTEYFLC